MDVLRTINAKPDLTTLTLDWNIMSGFSGPRPIELNMNLSFIRALPRVETLSLPFYLLSEPVFAAIAVLPHLKQLYIGQPLDMHFKVLGVILPPMSDFKSVVLERGSFPSLCALTLNVTFQYIPNALYTHLTSHITSLSLSCIPLPHTLSELFQAPLSSNALCASLDALQILDSRCSETQLHVLPPPLRRTLHTEPCITTNTGR
ncbi:hypothetical protein C0991_005743 [Blastosporella zonata]|nr:hypothetical protein C0991_005743 [Blastosporella zonata]